MFKWVSSLLLGAAVFCILLENWRIEGVLLGCGIGACYMLLKTEDKGSVSPVRLARYFGYLFVSLLKSTAKLMAIAVKPARAQIEILHLPVKCGERERVIISNSITLTPGTVTLEETETEYTVLCMAPPRHRNEVTGAFENRLMEKEESA